MSAPGSLVPSDEQAKAIQEALKTLREFGGFLKETFGTVPQDVVGLFGGDWLKVRRAENIVRVLQKAKKRLEARGAKIPEPASLSIALPLLVAAADESRDELQDIWARLMAAAADPARAGRFRLQEAAKKMDPLDAAVLSAGLKVANVISQREFNTFATELNASRDEIEISVKNLEKLNLFRLVANGPNTVISPFGREFMRAITD
jgi:hypothetical protein